MYTILISYLPDNTWPSIQPVFLCADHVQARFYPPYFKMETVYIRLEILSNNQKLEALTISEHPLLLF